MKTELALNLKGDTLTILEGKALELKHPEKIKLDGNIETVSNFVSKRHTIETWDGIKSLQQIDKNRAVVMVDFENTNIALHVDPENPFGTVITAKLELTPELEQFKINKPSTFSREELIKILRFNRRFFPYADKYEELLRAYQRMNISTATDLKQESDTRGNKGMNFQKAVNSENIPTEFILSIPIFKGQPVETFRVEICLDATDASVRFWFESIELAELSEIRKTEIFAAELESCQDFVIIYK